MKDPIGFHSESNIADFSNNFVLWGIDGDFEFNNIAKEIKFVTTDHCGAIRIKEDEILPAFLMLQLEKSKHKYGFDRGLRASLKNMKNVSIDVPFNDEGIIDVEKQKNIISKYEYTYELREKISAFRNTLKSLNISLTSLFINSQITYLKIDDIFDSPPTNSGLKKKDVSLEYSKKYCIPVYSATMNEDAVFGWVSEDSKWKKYENILTWNKDGSSGFVFYRKGKFAPYEKVKLLKTKKEFTEELSYEYFKHVIQNKLFEEGYGFNIKCSMDKVLKLTIPIPLKQNGQYDLDKQNELAKIYSQIDTIRKNILEELDKIFSINIDLE